MNRILKATALALLFLLLISGISSTEATANADQMINFNAPVPPELIKLTDEFVTPGYAIQFWHHSGNYWSNEALKLRFEDSAVTTNANGELTVGDMGGKPIEREVDLPQDVKDFLKNGGDISQIYVDWQMTGEKDWESYFEREHPPTYRLDNNKLYIEYSPVFRIKIKDPRYVYEGEGMEVLFPIIEPGFGNNVYAVYDKITKKELGSSRDIQREDILNHHGHLNPSKTYKYSAKDGSGEKVMDGAGIQIGHGTFHKAGAVGLEFVYPLRAEFYIKKPKNLELKDLWYSPADLKAGQTAKLSVEAINHSEQELNTELYTKIEGAIVKSEPLTLAAKESRRIYYDWTIPSDATKGNFKAEFAINANRNMPDDETNWSDNFIARTVNYEVPFFTPPLKHKDVRATSATLFWDAVPRAAKYRLECNGRLLMDNSLSTSFAAGGLTPDTDYVCTLRATSTTGQDGGQTTTRFKTPEIPPGADLLTYGALLRQKVWGDKDFDNRMNLDYVEQQHYPVNKVPTLNPLDKKDNPKTQIAANGSNAHLFSPYFAENLGVKMTADTKQSVKTWQFEKYYCYEEWWWDGECYSCESDDDDDDSGGGGSHWDNWWNEFFGKASDKSNVKVASLGGDNFENFVTKVKQREKVKAAEIEKERKTRVEAAGDPYIICGPPPPEPVCECGGSWTLRGGIVKSKFDGFDSCEVTLPMILPDGWNDATQNPVGSTVQLVMSWDSPYKKDPKHTAVVKSADRATCTGSLDPVWYVNKSDRSRQYYIPKEYESELWITVDKGYDARTNKILDPYKRLTLRTEFTKTDEVDSRDLGIRTIKIADKGPGAYNIAFDQKWSRWQPIIGSWGK